MADDQKTQELIKLLADQLAFHQEEIHKVNGRAILIFLSAAAGVATTVLSRQEATRTALELNCSLSAAMAFFFAVGAVSLACALARHSNCRAAFQRKIEEGINKLLMPGSESAAHQTDLSGLFVAQPNVNRSWPSWNLLLFVGTVSIIVGSLTFGYAVVRTSAPIRAHQEL
jgi:drug/metabolite transporter (DMT)-like permease